MSDKNELVEKIASRLYGECFVPAKEPFGDANAALLCHAMAEQLHSLCQQHYEQRVIDAILKLAAKEVGGGTIHTVDVTEAVREVFKK